MCQWCATFRVLTVEVAVGVHSRTDRVCVDFPRYLSRTIARLVKHMLVTAALQAVICV